MSSHDAQSQYHSTLFFHVQRVRPIQVSQEYRCNVSMLPVQGPHGELSHLWFMCVSWIRNSFVSSGEESAVVSTYISAVSDTSLSSHLSPQIPINLGPYVQPKGWRTTQLTTREDPLCGTGWAISSISCHDVHRVLLGSC